MSLKALLIGPGSGVILGFILYSINGWRLVFAVLGAFLILFIYILWTERPK